MALFLRVHAVVCSKTCLTVPTLLEIAIYRQLVFQSWVFHYLPDLAHQQSRTYDANEICRDS